MDKLDLQKRMFDLSEIKAGFSEGNDLNEDYPDDEPNQLINAR